MKTMKTESPSDAQLFELERATRVVIWVDSKYSFHQIEIPKERALNILRDDFDGWTLRLLADGSVEMEHRGEYTDELIVRSRSEEDA